jgi:hypothetical protein
MVTRSLLLLHIKHCLECREHHLQRMQEWERSIAAGLGSEKATLID